MMVADDTAYLRLECLKLACSVSGDRANPSHIMDIAEGFLRFVKDTPPSQAAAKVVPMRSPSGLEGSTKQGNQPSSDSDPDNKPE